MSLFAAISVALRQKLVEDGRPAPVTFNETMGGTYGYTSTTIRAFFIGVANRLAADTPAWKCNWVSLDPNACVADTVQVLEGAIANVTTATS